MRCVECGAAVKHVYQRFQGQGNIRLTQCANCHAFADKYVEYETILIVLDMILHKPEVYRHLLFNRDELHQRTTTALLKLLPVLLFLDIYAKWFRLRSFYGDGDSHHHTHMPYDRHRLLFVLCAFDMLSYFGGLILAVRLLQPGLLLRPQISLTELLRAVLTASFGKLFIILIMIWDYDVRFATGVSFFVLSSQITAIKVLLDSSTSTAMALVSVGFAAKVVVSRLFTAVIDPALFTVF